jgi:DNA-binding CsgD family transcriptional regulator
MARADRVLGLVEDLYAAPGTIEGWHTFLESLRRSLHGSSANLVSHHLQCRKSDIVANAGSDLDGLGSYQSHWAAFDPWAYSPKQRRPAAGAISVGEELIDHAELTRTAFYADFGRHYDLVRIIGGVLEAGPSGTSVVSVARGDQGQPFGTAESALLAALLPHLQRALQLHRRLSRAERVAADVATVIETSSRAVLLVDARLTVIYSNTAGARLTARRDGLTIDNGELRTARTADTTRLRELLADAIQTSQGEGLGAGGMITVGRPSGGRPFAVLVCPVAQQMTAPLVGGSAAAIVFINDPEQVVIPDEPDLQALFGLTPAEARLTALLAQGASLGEAADRLGVREATVRSRLKSVFLKTGTHRQAELIGVVLNALPRI